MFSNSLDSLLKVEGGYSNVTADTGGETYAGITRKNFPMWEGWSIVDKNKPLTNNKKIPDPKLKPLISAFYKTNFWDKLKADSLNKNIANLLFDFAVNSGVVAASKGLQTAINNSGQSVTVDGAIGPLTISAANKCNQKKLFDNLFQYRKDFYNKIVNANTSQKVFLQGWLNRLNTFTFENKTTINVTLISLILVAGLIFIIKK